MIVRLVTLILISLIEVGLKNVKSWFIFTGTLVRGVYFILSEYSEEFRFQGFGLMVDSSGMLLVVLRLWVGLLILFSRYKIVRFREFSYYFLFLIYGLTLVLVLTFIVEDYLIFYFIFEISLIPTLLIIMGWGYQPERLQAGVYFIFYTLTASLPLLIAVNYFLVNIGRLNFILSLIAGIVAPRGSHIILLYLMAVMAFLVKIPIYYTHLWLPKAHVEAPVAGSIILAGVLLKLGGYGLIRVLLVIGPFLRLLNSYFVGLRLVAIVYVGLICCRLNDFKALVAYSSVAHIGMVICGVINVYEWGVNGCLIIIISHGVASSGLFCIVNMYYERLGRRSFYINKGLLLIFPSFSLIIFLLTASNIAAPPTINLLSEIFLMSRILSFDWSMMVVFPLGSFLGAVFSIYMFSYTQHGRGYFLGYSYVGPSHRELHTLLIHIIPINMLFLNPSLFLGIQYLNSLIKMGVCGASDRATF